MNKAENNIEALAQLAARSDERETLLRKRPIFHIRSMVNRAIRALLRLDKAKERQVPGKLWTWAFHELPIARKTEPSRQILRRALAKTAYKKLKEQYGGMNRGDLRPLASALAKKTFRETPKARLLEMYETAERYGGVR